MICHLILFVVQYHCEICHLKYATQQSNDNYDNYKQTNNVKA